MPYPAGQIQMAPAPTVAGVWYLREYTVGAVGEVAHDSAVTLRDAGSLFSCGVSDAVPPGVTPMAAGRPKPWLDAVPVTCAKPHSITRGLFVAADRSSTLALLMVVFVVRTAAS